MTRREIKETAVHPVHPGEVLLEEFLKPLDITQTRLAAHLRTSIQRVNELIKGKRSITAETAWLLSEAFGTTPQFWINLQSQYDLATHRPGYHVKPIKRAG
jgi:addiction module HigA family antidote